MALQKGNGVIIEILHTFALQDGIADSSEVPGYILKTLLDVNNPVGALVFVCVIVGIFIIFIAILDSMKPPNFPPGPRWLPFGGDSSGLCEKPLTTTTTTRLAEQFGPVVGLRQNSAPRNPLVLALDSASAETLEDASRNGFLECQNDCPEFAINGFTGLTYLYKNQIIPILLTDNITKAVENCALEATHDLFEVLKNTSQQSDSSLISVTCLAALVNVITGQRIKPNSSHLAHLYLLLINNSKWDHVMNDNQWTGNAEVSSHAPQYYSKIIMALSDLEEHEMSKQTKSSQTSVLKILRQNHRPITLPEKFAIIAEIILRINFEHYSTVINKFLNTLLVKHLQTQTELFISSNTKQTCCEICNDLVHNIARKFPILKVSCRWKVVKTFYLNGFTVPQGANVQFILNRRECHPFSISGEQYSPEEQNMIALLSRVLCEIICCPEAVKKFTTGHKNVIM